MSKTKSNLQKIFEFTGLLNKFRNITRTVLANGTDREENDMEHSYMLAMQADYIISLENLSLNREKVMTYCLVHDFVEVYAGDTPFHSTDKEYINSKKSRETDSLKQITKEFPEHKNLLKTIHNYESRLDLESRFVYALDKIQPIINIYLDNGRSWKRNGVDLGNLIKYKKDKVKFSPIVEKYWNELRDILEKNQQSLFSK